MFWNPLNALKMQFVFQLLNAIHRTFIEQSRLFLLTDSSHTTVRQWLFRDIWIKMEADVWDGLQYQSFLMKSDESPPSEYWWKRWGDFFNQIFHSKLLIVAELIIAVDEGKCLWLVTLTLFLLFLVFLGGLVGWERFFFTLANGGNKL